MAVTVGSEGNKIAEVQRPEDDRLADPSHYAESSARENLI
jgi:hypothetical protein